MSKNVMWFGLSIIASFVFLYLISLNANFGANMTAGIGLFFSGWNCCYHSGKYLGYIRSQGE